MYHAVVAIFMVTYEWSRTTGVAWLFFAAFGHGVGWLHPLQGKTIPLANGRGSPCSARGGT